jgi:hypothetical protein
MPHQHCTTVHEFVKRLILNTSTRSLNRLMKQYINELMVCCDCVYKLSGQTFTYCKVVRNSGGWLHSASLFIADSTRGFTAEWNILQQSRSADQQYPTIYNWASELEYICFWLPHAKNTVKVKLVLPSQPLWLDKRIAWWRGHVAPLWRHYGKGEQSDRASHPSRCVSPGDNDDKIVTHPERGRTYLRDHYDTQHNVKTHKKQTFLNQNSK